MEVTCVGLLGERDESRARRSRSVVSMRRSALFREVLGLLIGEWDREEVW
jgi:hypothetical protein